MSSSTFEVTETENESEKELNFGLEACDENGIGLSAQDDGEIQKDHTYTKDPDGSEEEDEKADDSQQETEKPESSPEKRSVRNSRNSKVTKKQNAKSPRSKRETFHKKEITTSKRAKANKDVLTEESNKTEDGAKTEKSDEKNGPEDTPKSPKRGRKRKVEEKENVIDRSIVEEVQNINEGDSVTDVSAESPAKKKNSGDKNPKSKKAKTAPAEEEDNQNLPKGWVRKAVVRKSGKTAGLVDIYIYSPEGKKFRSRPDVAAYLAKIKSNLKPEDFDFSKRKASNSGTPVKAAPKKEKPTPASKPKIITEKKKVQSPAASPKKASKLVVKLNFSPKSKKGKNVRKTTTDKQAKQSKTPVKSAKPSGSNAKASKKKKTA